MGETVLYQPKDDSFAISGITLDYLSVDSPTATPVPRDPDLACLTIPMSRSRRDFAHFYTANILGRDINKENGLEVGYPVHVHCWPLVKRVIGDQLVEANLKTFVKAILQFWRENSEWWDLLPFLKERCERCEYEGEKCVHIPDSGRKRAPTGRNPTVIPKIENLIQQAAAQKASSSGEDRPQTHRQKRQKRHERRQQSIISQIPLDISIEIVETLDSKDAENMLTAFGWQLPDIYWQSRCQKEVVFEFQDLIDNRTPIDWQFLALRSQRSLKGLLPLQNRARIVKFLQGLKEIFLAMLEKDKVSKCPRLGA